MGKLDGVSRELYPGETKIMREKLARHQARDNFTIRETRIVERKTASGHKVLYKMRGYFNAESR